MNSLEHKLRALGAIDIGAEVTVSLYGNNNGPSRNGKLESINFKDFTIILTGYQVIGKRESISINDISNIRLA